MPEIQKYTPARENFLRVETGVLTSEIFWGCSISLGTLGTTWAPLEFKEHFRIFRLSQSVDNLGHFGHVLNLLKKSK